ncbi:MAG: hypothetical protein CMH27_08350 [Micavibrio sp.]|nr:hypothetical protein [Micavibrio sp.]|tara:strand:+ start:6319 stop:7212 length:894 start_codon:yes stop_codon:yes gene_type:complete
MNKKQDICPVSVILPCYKAADTIAMALKSAAFQTRPPAEIIIMDDGSPDNSRAVIENTIKEIDNQTPSKIIFLPFEKNRGVYPVRNDGLREASQPYLAFLDADDYWHPQKLEIQYLFFERDPDLALSCHGVKYRDGGPETLDAFADDHEHSTKILKNANVLYRNVMVTISIMIKKPENLLFDESKPRGSDMLFWLEIVLRGGKAMWIRDYMSFTAKPLYGASGLSGNIWKAEMAQQDNLNKLWKRGYISLPYSLFLRAFSFAKMIRRYIIYILRVMKGKDPNPATVNPPVRRRFVLF